MTMNPAINAESEKPVTRRSCRAESITTRDTNEVRQETPKRGWDGLGLEKRAMKKQIDTKTTNTVIKCWKNETHQ